MNRRTFLESTAATALLSSLPAYAMEASRKVERIGVQLYTVREPLKKDFEGTLAKVAKAGYKEVEFAGYANHSPKDVRAVLERNGLSAPSCHVDYKAVTVNLPQTIEAAHEVGHEYIVCPWIDESLRKQPDGYKQVAEQFNKTGESCKKAGMKFGYHNHDFEFAPDAHLGGKAPYDFLLVSTDPELVKMEMDLCWAMMAGMDPVAYFNNYPGRFPLVHVKDMKKLPHPKPEEIAAIKMDEWMPQMTEVGSGVIDWKRIFTGADKGGVKLYIVEHDEPKDPFASIQTSYNYLHNLRY